jgi:hypothetical protein
MKPNGATWNLEGFYDHRNVSFIGRPFPLEEVDEHFVRLKTWGFTFLRFLVTWEAIEHSGPGIYDEEYLTYLYEVISRAAEHGIDVFIDPHQDAWSRFTGGDGAPGWTLEAAGFDLTRLHRTGAAFTHQENGDPYPRMIWPTNCNKLAAGTMFTLFFAGNDFAPEITVDAIPIQEYLQAHYMNAIKQVAMILRGLTNVIGYDTLNEPSSGFIGLEDISNRSEVMTILKGDSPTVFQGMAAGAGYPQEVDVFKLGLTGFVKTGRKILNPGRESAWLPDRKDIWLQHGVWGLDRNRNPVIQQPDYFSRVNGRQVDFYQDYFKPFANRFAREVRSVAPKTIIFIEGVPSEDGISWGKQDAGDIVHAAHWYDGLTLFTKRFVSWFTMDSRTRKVVLGKQAVKRCFNNQIADTIRHSSKEMGGVPTLIGETGIPFDMLNKKAYRSGNFSHQLQAMDATMSALEMNLVNFTLWNYTADNTNTRGDQWNDEDLSIFSTDQRKNDGSIYDGGRAIRAVVRPYPRKTAGTPTRFSFDMVKSIMEYSFIHFDVVIAPTEIFIPLLHYPRGCIVEVSDGTWKIDKDQQVLFYTHDPKFVNHTLRISPA